MEIKVTIIDGAKNNVREFSDAKGLLEFAEGLMGIRTTDNELKRGDSSTQESVVEEEVESPTESELKKNEDESVEKDA